VSVVPDITSIQNSTTITCQNTVAGIVYYFQTATNSLSQARADIFLMDTISANLNANISIEQFFEVKFVDSSVKKINLLSS
jgi:methionine synthase I (cobalamin-dependent)